MSPPAHLILVAYQCAPGGGSVSQIGWEWYQRLAARLPVTLVTHIRNRSVLEAAGAPLPHSHVHYIDSEWFAGPLYRLSKTLFPRSEHARFMLASLDYFVFDHLACQLLRSLPMPPHTILHRVTPVSPSAASKLPSLGYPCVLGPLNGGLGQPHGFGRQLQAEQSWLYRLSALGRKLDQWRRRRSHADMVLYATAATRACLPPAALPHAVSMLENGVDLSCFQASAWPPAPDKRTALRLGFTGRLIPVKGIDLLLQACANWQQQHPAASLLLDIVGDGPLRAQLQQQAQTLGVHARFLGALPHDQVAAAMASWHALVLPSLRESGGAVLMEAMACERPCIVFNWGGPGELVDNSVGYRIEADSPATLINGLQHAFDDLLHHPDAWRERSRQARLRAEQCFDWHTRVDKMLSLYNDVLHRHETSTCNISFTLP